MLLPDGHVRLPIAVQLDHVPMCVCVCLLVGLSVRASFACLAHCHRTDLIGSDDRSL